MYLHQKFCHVDTIGRSGVGHRSRQTPFKLQGSEKEQNSTNEDSKRRDNVNLGQRSTDTLLRTLSVGTKGLKTGVSG